MDLPILSPGPPWGFSRPRSEGGESSSRASGLASVHGRTVRPALGEAEERKRGWEIPCLGGLRPSVFWRDDPPIFGVSLKFLVAWTKNSWGIEIDLFGCLNRAPQMGLTNFVTPARLLRSEPIDRALSTKRGFAHVWLIPQATPSLICLPQKPFHTLKTHTNRSLSKPNRCLPSTKEDKDVSCQHHPHPGAKKKTPVGGGP